VRRKGEPEEIGRNRDEGGVTRNQRRGKLVEEGEVGAVSITERGGTLTKKDSVMWGRGRANLCLDLEYVACRFTPQLRDIPPEAKRVPAILRATREQARYSG